jgi:2-oxoisovalerate dehydrogenase E1 component alpha subunit
MYASMVRVQVLDDIMYHAQRQGRISFYMQATGEEATHIGIQLRQLDFLP